MICLIWRYPRNFIANTNGLLSSRGWAPVLNDDQRCREAQLQRGLVASDGGRCVPDYPLMLKLILCLKETARLSDWDTRPDLVSTMAKMASSHSFPASITGLAPPLIRLDSNTSDCGVYAKTEDPERTVVDSRQSLVALSTTSLQHSFPIPLIHSKRVCDYVS
jgi:hypothetical protein